MCGVPNNMKTALIIIKYCLKSCSHRFWEDWQPWKLRDQMNIIQKRKHEKHSYHSGVQLLLQFFI